MVCGCQTSQTCRWMLASTGAHRGLNISKGSPPSSHTKAHRSFRTNTIHQICLSFHYQLPLTRSIGNPPYLNVTFFVIHFGIWKSVFFHFIGWRNMRGLELSAGARELIWQYLGAELTVAKSPVKSPALNSSPPCLHLQKLPWFTKHFFGHFWFLCNFGF